MMDKRDKKELIAGIRDFLRDFEEPYDHREWAHFQRYRKKQRKSIPRFVKLAGIAASLFLMVYASVKYLPLLDGIDNRKTPVQKQAPDLMEDAGQYKRDSVIVDSIPPAVDAAGQNKEQIDAPPTRMPQTSRAVSDMQLGDPVFAGPTDAGASTPGSLDGLPSINKGEIETVPMSKHVAPGWKPQTGTSHRVEDIKLPALRLSTKNRLNLGDIKFGANLNSALTDKGLVLGGGLSAQIAFTNRMSAEIGLSYSSMTAGKRWAADMSDTTGSQVVESRNTIGMVSLPVSLNYAFTERFSVSLGLAPFSAVRDRRTDVIQSNRWVHGDMLSGDTTRRIISERTESNRPDSIYRGNNYWGFIQLSGYVTPPFLQRYNTVIAPYVGIPVGRLRNDRYRWLHGGVSLRFYVQ
ncbi:hypothetical protein SAMN05660226_00410 [Parapedobacter luteus]|uniref:Outer membrane protein beta-barrel domain-containing protein n=1 Tax=Parapedobacter luteus TaxID=623280 RepID=A0A1T5A1F4_9SPHI|nr:hypothetical protein [Parapedobacter luteus]SKB28675.1 hypothetical protein SAMN05660226_00410 [Parapedobacter luteus]